MSGNEIIRYELVPGQGFSFLEADNHKLLKIGMTIEQVKALIGEHEGYRADPGYRVDSTWYDSEQEWKEVYEGTARATYLNKYGLVVSYRFGVVEGIDATDAEFVLFKEKNLKDLGWTGVMTLLRGQKYKLYQGVLHFDDTNLSLQFNKGKTKVRSIGVVDVSRYKFPAGTVEGVAK